MALDPAETLPKQPCSAPLRVAFFGTPALALPTLEAMLAAPEVCEVVLVVCQPDKPSGRGRELRAPPVAARAKELGLPLLQPRRVRSGEFPDAVEAANLDVAVVIAYGRILTTRLLEAPRFGCVNVHASLLPRWRGAGPIQWSLIGGDDVTGVCTMWMEEGLDSGPVLLRREERIRPDDTAVTLGDRLGRAGAELLVETLRELHAGRLTATPQDEAGVTLAPMLTKDDGRIRWEEPARAILRRAAGTTPWPGPFCGWRGRTLRVHGIEAADGVGAAGTVLSADDAGVVVACGDGALRLTRVQPPNKKPMAAGEFLRGYPLEVGESLTHPPLLDAS
jgi:methionyl-tRNA formyltransferase